MDNAPEAFEKWWRALPLRNGAITADHIRQAWDAGVLFEREACAKLVEAEGDCRHVDHVQGFCECQPKADAIRSRSN